MITLTLFEQSDLTRQIDRRPLAEGETVVGRGVTCDWAVPDPSKTLSRRHCVFTLRDGRIGVRDESTNGLFDGGGARLPAQSDVALAIGDTIALGGFVIAIDQVQLVHAGDAPSTTTLAPLNGSPAGRLLDAFCAGAQIDLSLLSAEDPGEVMRRIGAIYRQMVVGLAELTNERTRQKDSYGLDWTAVQALDNNPFRWAPAHRVAVDLLQPRDDGFLSAEAAVRASFDDLHDHQRGLAQGWQAARAALLNELSPDAVARSAKAQPRFGKRGDALWTEFERVHAEVSGAPDPGGEAFREGYRGDAAVD